jgi:hypothetical protein
MSARRGEEQDDDEVVDFDGVDPRRRATLLEGEAEELRDRLDTLLAELGRHRRMDAADLFRRYAIVSAIALLATATAVALVSWRHRRLV